jgi:hypothetical protein
MTLTKHRPTKGQSVLLSIVIDSDLWSVPVKGKLVRNHTAFLIQSGRVWRGAVIQAGNCKVLKGEV